MFRFKTIKCANCKSVIMNLPEDELEKLNGILFRCECCNHLNKLNEYALISTREQNSDSMHQLILRNAL